MLGLERLFYLTRNNSIMSSSSSEMSSSSPDSTDPASLVAFPPVPSKEGQKLMASGVFGVSNILEPHSKRIAERILDRELGLGSRKQRHVSRGLMMQGMIPSTKPEMIIHYRDSVCCGQFSDDGSFFFACVKVSGPYQSPSVRDWC